MKASSMKRATTRAVGVRSLVPLAPHNQVRARRPDNHNNRLAPCTNPKAKETRNIRAFTHRLFM
jgi:hypothetical protein